MFFFFFFFFVRWQWVLHQSQLLLNFVRLRVNSCCAKQNGTANIYLAIIRLISSVENKEKIWVGKILVCADWLVVSWRKRFCVLDRTVCCVKSCCLFCVWCSNIPWENDEFSVRNSTTVVAGKVHESKEQLSCQILKLLCSRFNWDGQIAASLLWNVSYIYWFTCEIPWTLLFQPSSFVAPRPEASLECTCCVTRGHGNI